MSINKKYDYMDLNELKALYIKMKFGPGPADKINKHEYYAVKDAYERRRPIRYWYSVDPKPEDEQEEPWDGIIYNKHSFINAIKAGCKNPKVHLYY